MKLFARYLIKKWFLLFVASLAVLISVYLAGDVAMTIWDLIGKGLPSNKIVLHYFLKLPTTFYLVAPVASLLASLLTLTGLKRTGELGALFYSGIGRFRLGVPILAATLFVSFMSLYINDKVAPAANKLSRDIERDVSGTTTYLVGTNRIWLLEDNRVIHIRNVENKGTILIEPTVLIFNNASLQELGARIDAPRAVWQDGRWVMEEGIRRTFMKGTVSAVEGPKVISPPIQIYPEEFSTVKRVPEEMNLRELKGYVRNLKKAGLRYHWYEVRIYRKS
ncbi:MAG: LptF/LptG family permease, partial [bacterium]